LKQGLIVNRDQDGRFVGVDRERSTWPNRRGDYTMFRDLRLCPPRVLDPGDVVHRAADRDAGDRNAKIRDDGQKRGEDVSCESRLHMKSIAHNANAEQARRCVTRPDLGPERDYHRTPV